jgi:hypothetical protein
MPQTQDARKLVPTDNEESRLREALATVTVQRDAALWALRVVRRDIHWYDGSPTLRIVEQVLGQTTPREDVNSPA